MVTEDATPPSATLQGPPQRSPAGGPDAHRAPAAIRYPTLGVNGVWV